MRLRRIETLFIALTILVFVLGFWWFPGTVGVDSDSYSVARPGKRVFYQALRQLEGDVRRSTEQLIPTLTYDDRILILGPARNPTEDEWDLIEDEVFYGTSVVFAVSPAQAIVDVPQFGVSIRSDDPLFDDIDEDSSLDEGDDSLEQPTDSTEEQDTENSEKTSEYDDNAFHWEIAPRLNESTAATDLIPNSTVWRSNAWLEFDDPDEWTVLVTADGRPQVAVTEYEYGGSFVICASDEVFSNAAMTDPDQALLAFRILEQAPSLGITYFDETLNSSGVPKIVGLLFEPQIRPLTLQFVLIAILFGWLGSRRFGPVHVDLRRRRRSIVEHAQALGNLYFRSRSGGDAIQYQHEYFKLQLHAMYGPGFRVDDPDVVARQARLKPENVQLLYKQIQLAMSRHREGKLSNSDAAKVLRKLTKVLARIRSDDLGQHSRTPSSKQSAH